MKTLVRNLSLLTAALMIAPALLAEGEPAAKVGTLAPAFALPDPAGTAHSLEQYKGKIVVLEWVNYDCPFVKKHYGADAMQSLQRELTGKGIVWLTICSSAPGKQGHYEAAKWPGLVAERKAAPSAVLLDPDGKVGKLYNAKTTPHMFIIGTDGKLAYQGAIDDKPSFNPDTLKDARNYVREAVTALLDGKPLPVAETQAYGCSVKY
ncbi:MAG: thiol-disulfide oxidoreductase [Lentisphaerae bacterium ADurb.BinA184]|nr:MAG: thiol-disulfide oxidoreductase [Lentisphaerae bacterium ADurb.BinA184]